MHFNYKKYIIPLLILFAAALTGILIIRYPGNDRLAQIEKMEPVPYQPRMLYGINIDSLKLEKKTVKRNEFLADILLDYDVDYPTIDRLARQSRDIFDVRKIRYGNPYTLMFTEDSLPHLQYFVYEINPIDYVVYDFDDSLRIKRAHKEITVKVDTATGIINSSLWNAMIDNHTDPNLANALSEIYAWTIDFFGIQKGDSYKVIYETRYADGEKIGIGNVLAATFNHMGDPYNAIYFVQDSTGDYFDESANSLRRTFLKAPLRYRRISSRFSYSRMHPVLKYRRPHLGVDYAADRGTPVMSVGDGRVIFAKWDKGGGGRAVKIKHNGTYTTLYMHLSKYGKGIKAGAHVRQGQVIGYVGASGLATGPHLDFRFYRNGKPVDPLKVESPPAEPVDSTNLARFEKEKQHWLRALQAITISEPDSVLVQAGQE